MKRVAAFAKSLLLALAAGSASCGGGEAGEPRPQWFVDVYTDAPVPQLGDRVLVEVLASDGALACPGCRRLFVGLGRSSAWPLSFGIPDSAGNGLRLRVRLFRADHSDAGGAPAGGLPIDSLAALPATGGAVRRVAVTLYTACSGVAADLERFLTCDPATGDLTASTLEEVAREGAPRPGSFPLAQSTPCSRVPREGMACVQGGLFARGSSIFALDETALLSPVPERLVRVTPFALDRQEMTVRQMRALVDSGLVARPVARGLSRPACTWTDAPDAFEDFPVNCIGKSNAALACSARGTRLPTEAEWEFAAGDRDEEKRYPWGADPDACRFAIVGRGRIIPEGGPDGSIACRTEADGQARPWGPRPTAEGDDITALGIRHLGGNVSEWVSDAAGSYAGPCSEGPSVLVNPRCDRGTADESVVRGGSWTLPPSYAQTSHRSTYSQQFVGPEVGFRCAESM